MDVAESGNASHISRLRLVTGPAVNVSGAATTPRRGMRVL